MKMADVPEIPVVNTLIKVDLCQKLQQVQAGVNKSLRAHSFPFLILLKTTDEIHSFI